MTNKKPGRCGECGASVEAGQGRLWRCLGSSGCSQHYDTGDDGAWHVSCLDTEACAVRAAAVRTEASTRARAREERAKALRELRAAFARGTMPAAGSGDPLEGETVHLDGRHLALYGAGEYAVIGADRIWWVARNGADGDDWSRNNCSGGIGRWLPRTPELERQVRALEQPEDDALLQRFAGLHDPSFLEPGGD